ncbi:MAG: twin-arginine translocase subunit TatC [Chloroflexi bacterium]|nr:twin-arginine translocase subunit TatC [Chloroflexota bacterium]
MSDKKLSVLGHLLELRKRLLRGVIAVVITTIISFVFADQIFEVLKRPLGPDATLIYVDMTEMFSTYMKVCLASGLVLAMPVIVYHFLMFIAPALTSKEKRMVFMIAPWIALMFLGGVAFAYFILLPPAVTFLTTWGSDIATAQIRIGNYISVVTKLLLVMGFIFETPVITTFLAKIGVVKPQWLASKRRGAALGAFVLAALVTPTADPVNQTLVAVPLIALYEMSIWLAKLVAKKPAPAMDSALVPDQTKS